LSKQSLEEVWNGAEMVRLRQSILDGYVDKICRNAGCNEVRDTVKMFGVEAFDLRCAIGEEIDLRDSGRPDHCVSGWYDPEPWGVWSKGRAAQLLLDLTDRPSKDLRLEVLCRGAGHARAPEMRVEVQMNGEDVDVWLFRYPDTTEHSVWRGINLPAATTSKRIDVRFVIETPISPQTWSRNDDRLLGIGLSALRVIAD
jgi:hypothetical protein